MNGDNKSHMIVSWQERENRKVLSHCLKTASDGADATWRGRSFQTVAPETVARLPTVERRTGGTSRRCEVEDRSRHLDVMSETRVKHDREVPWMDRYRRVITFSLKEMHSGTRSQWRQMRAEAMCSDRRLLKITRAAVFWTDWRRWMRLAGSPNRTLIQPD